ncbi:MAG: hypothetical protein PVJ09_02845 [Candidatus Woesebacteria bacterium]
MTENEKTPNYTRVIIISASAVRETLPKLINAGYLIAGDDEKNNRAQTKGLRFTVQNQQEERTIMSFLQSIGQIPVSRPRSK